MIIVGRNKMQYFQLKESIDREIVLPTYPPITASPMTTHQDNTEIVGLAGGVVVLALMHAFVA